MTEEQIQQIIRDVLLRIGHLSPMKMLDTLDYSHVKYTYLQEHYGLISVSENQVWQDTDPLLIPELTNQQLMAIYNGSPCDILGKSVVDGLILGRNIYVFEENIEWKEGTHVNTPYTRRYEDAYTILKKSGLEVIAQAEQKIMDQKVISKQVVEEVIRQGKKQVCLKQHQILTPLAKEILRDSGVQVDIVDRQER